GAFGDAAVVENDEMDFEGDPSRDYRVLGVDAAYQWNNFDFRGEYIQQDIGDQVNSVAPEGGKWETWYVQGAYKFAQAKWEGVLRYADYTSPHADDSQKQVALGLNYLVAPNAVIKLGYEINDGLSGEETDSDRWMIQIAYGY
ncbi:MAG: porin, partial [Pseudomonadales bacterium]